MDAHNGFSGLGSAFVEYLREEYAKNTIYAVPNLLLDSKTTSENHVLNSLLCYDSLADSASMFSPISMYRDVGRKVRDPLLLPGITYKVSRFRYGQKSHVPT